MKRWNILFCLPVFLAVLGGCSCAVPEQGKKTAAAQSDPLKLFLPPVIYAAPGVECNIYYANIFNAIVPENFVYLVQCAKGAPQTHRWCWTPQEADAGKTFPLTVEVRNDDGVIDRAQCIVQVAAPVKNPERKITLALLSASSANGGYPQHLMEAMHQNGFPNYTPVGTYFLCGLPLTPGRAASDSYGGWTWRHFLHQWKYSASEYNNVHDEAEKEQMKIIGIRTVNQRREYQLKSPLLKSVNGKIVRDVQGWFDRINGGKAPDFIIIDLGLSEIFSAREDQIHDRLTRHIRPAMKDLLDELRKAAPEATIGVCLQYMGSRDQSAFAANYGCMQSRYQLQRNKRLYDEMAVAFIKDRKDPEIILLPYYQNIDPVWGFPTKMVPVSAREKTLVRRGINGLHTSQSGSYQHADAVYSWLLNQLNRKGW